MVYVLRYVIRARNHIAASVDEKGVRREVPNEHIFCDIIWNTYVERMAGQLLRQRLRAS